MAGEGYAELWRFVQDRSGASDEETFRFFTAGMLLTVDTAVTPPRPRSATPPMLAGVYEFRPLPYAASRHANRQRRSAPL